MLRLSELCSELFRRQSLKTQLVWQFLVGISWKIPNKALSRIIYVKCQNWANGDLSDKITPWKNCSVFFSILIGHFFSLLSMDLETKGFSPMIDNAMEIQLFLIHIDSSCYVRIYRYWVSLHKTLNSLQAPIYGLPRTWTYIFISFISKLCDGPTHFTKPVCITINQFLKLFDWRISIYYIGYNGPRYVTV